jgi:hypothetical protein
MKYDPDDSMLASFGLPLNLGIVISIGTLVAMAHLFRGVTRGDTTILELTYLFLVLLVYPLSYYAICIGIWQRIIGLKWFIIGNIATTGIILSLFLISFGS